MDWLHRLLSQCPLEVAGSKVDWVSNNLSKNAMSRANQEY